MVHIISSRIQNDFKITYSLKWKLAVNSKPLKVLAAKFSRFSNIFDGLCKVFNYHLSNTCDHGKSRKKLTKGFLWTYSLARRLCSLKNTTCRDVNTGWTFDRKSPDTNNSFVGRFTGFSLATTPSFFWKYEKRFFWFAFL